MGSSSSKIKAAAAAGNGRVARKFPSRVPEAPEAQAQPTPPGDQAGPELQDLRTDAGAFSQRVHQMGLATQPSLHAGPTTSTFPWSRNNAALSALEARRALQRRADDDLASTGMGRGRRLLDMRAAIDALRLRDSGMPSSDIEARLGLQAGIMEKLGGRRVLTHLLTNQ